MLRMVPRAPQKISTSTLLANLKSEGFEASQRTIQRDLKDLAVDFPDLKSDENRDMAGWFWAEKGELLSIPAIDPPVAFTLKLADTFLSRLMPPAITDLLEPFRKASDSILDKLDRSHLSRWKDKVQILPRTQQLIPAEVAPDVIRTVYTALLEGKQFSGHYTRRGDDEANYLFNPLGIVYRESVIYLVATLWDYKDIRHFALHRFTEVQALDTPRKRPKGFRLSDYVEGGDFDISVVKHKILKLKLLFEVKTGDHLLETPLSQDQTVTIKKDGRYQVRATVNDSLQIRWWLLGFGNNVEVQQPKSLRDEFTQISKNLYGIYHGE
jgi:predicted DNA-binding transcriptional regulator YafY